VNGYIRSLKAFLNWADREGYELSIDARKVSRLKEPQRVPPTLTAEQIAAILAAPNKRTFVGLRDFTLMALMLDTGVRLGEVRGLAVADVSIPFVQVVGKGDKQRTVAMSPVMQGHLRKWLRAREATLAKAGLNTPVLFPSRTGGALGPKGVHGLIRKAAKAAGIEGVRVSPHTFRYTYATCFLRNGGNIVSLQQVLGHTTLAMSRRYAAMVDEDAFEESMRCSPLAAAGGRRDRQG
jgi:integrase/recombinase XerD